MKKFINVTILLSLLITDFAGAIDAPQLTISTNDLTASINWTSVPQTTQYILHYTPIPYVPGQTIHSVDMGMATNLEVTLWDGAAFYVAITTTNINEISDFSNIEELVVNIGSPDCMDFSGDYTFVLYHDCDNNYRFTIADSGTILQNNCDITFQGEEGVNISGSVNEMVMSFDGNFIYEGHPVTLDGYLSYREDGKLIGYGESSLNIPTCSSTAVFQGFRK